MFTTVKSTNENSRDGLNGQTLEDTVWILSCFYRLLMDLVIGYYGNIYFLSFITSFLQRSRDPKQLKRKSTDQAGHGTFSNVSASSFTTNSIFGCLGLKSGTSAGNIIR